MLTGSKIYTRYALTPLKGSHAHSAINCEPAVQAVTGFSPNTPTPPKMVSSLGRRFFPVDISIRTAPFAQRSSGACSTLWLATSDIPKTPEIPDICSGSRISHILSFGRLSLSIALEFRPREAFPGGLREKSPIQCTYREVGLEIDFHHPSFCRNSQI